MKQPNTSSGDNSAYSDTNYIMNNYNDPTKWNQNTNQFGTEAWHSAFLQKIKTGSGLYMPYSNMYSWYLFDEPYGSGLNRDYASNQFSVQGHSSFCSGVENSGTVDKRPKMVDINPSPTSAWNNLSNNIDILCGNRYGGWWEGAAVPRQLWHTPNMVAWCYSKIVNSDDKMVMAWLPGYIPNLAYNYYLFYASIINGARGILWWMNYEGEQEQYDIKDYSNYTYQKSAHSNFTSTKLFKSDGGQKDSDRSVILNGTDPLTLIWSNRPVDEENYFSNYIYGPYPVMLNHFVDALAIKFNNRYRIYVVNHYTGQKSFSVAIDTNELTNSGWSNAWDYTGTVHQMTPYNQRYYLSDSLPANAYRIYDIGAGN